MASNTSGCGLSFLSMSALSLALWSGQAQVAEARLLAPPEPGDKAMALAHDLSSAFQKVAKEVTPAVVNVTTFGTPQMGNRLPQGLNLPNDPMMDEMLRQFFGDQAPELPQRRFRNRAQPQAQPEAAKQQLSSGSGIIVSADGYILTNNHVIESAAQMNGTVEVSLADNRKLSAKIIGRDSTSDLAVLKVEAGGLKYAELGDSEGVEVGQWVLAIGSPFGFNQTVTAGIISGKGRQINAGGRRGGFEDFLQTDAAINPGNSGGALVNLEGKVIGINTAIFTRSGGYMGIGFAIPSTLAKNVMEQLKATGTVQRGWLGVDMAAELTSDMAKSLGFDGTAGVLVAGVQPGSPAETAGLKAEDIVVTIDGRATPNPDALRSVIGNMPPGKSVKIDIVRAGERKTLTVAMGNREEALKAAGAAGGAANVDNKLGVAVVEMNAGEAQRLNAGNVRGVVVKELAPTSPLAQIGVQADDVIVQINGQPTPDAAAFARIVETVDTERQGVRVVIWRDGFSTVLFYRGPAGRR